MSQPGGEKGRAGPAGCSALPGNEQGKQESQECVLGESSERRTRVLQSRGCCGACVAVAQHSATFGFLGGRIPGGSWGWVGCEEELLHWKSGQALEQLLRAALEAPVLEVFGNEGMWHFGIGFSGDGGIGTELGLGDLRGFSQPF